MDSRVSGISPNVSDAMDPYTLPIANETTSSNAKIKKITHNQPPQIPPPTFTLEELTDRFIELLSHNEDIPVERKGKEDKGFYRAPTHRTKGIKKDLKKIIDLVADRLGKTKEQVILDAAHVIGTFTTLKDLKLEKKPVYFLGALETLLLNRFY